MTELPIWIVYSKTKSQSAGKTTTLYGKIVVPALSIDDAISNSRKYLENDGQELIEIFKCLKFFKSELERNPEDYTDIKPSIERAIQTQQIYGSFYSEEHLKRG